MSLFASLDCLFFFNDTATTEIYTLSLHDALPISREVHAPLGIDLDDPNHDLVADAQDRKSTRLNSSHANISYAVFCLKKKRKATTTKSTSPERTRLRTTSRQRPTAVRAKSTVRTS